MELTFDDFKSRANDPNLTQWEKIGFPDSYRKDSEELILKDILHKLSIKDVSKPGLKVLDIGCGCSNLVKMLIKHCNEYNHLLFLNDSKEMLCNIPSEVIKTLNGDLMPGKFPEDFKNNTLSFDAIIVYSVIQYPYIESNIYSFLHSCINLLVPGGKLLIGDIPNVSKRERFLKSSEGEKFKKNKLNLNTSVIMNHDAEERIDDAIIFSIMQRFRSFNCETYLLPQPNSLPFANRREDILIIKR